MSWSLRLGKVFGIDVKVHLTFFLLLAFLAVTDLVSTGSALVALSGLAFVVAVFGSVLLHELGHALMARRFGVQTRDITLLPIGGVARLEGMPKRPLQEMLIAIAGPMVNVAIAGALFVGASLVGHQVGLAGILSGDFASRLLWTNAALAVFNMLPAFPMDGGRVLRALLAIHRPYLEATRIAARVARWTAAALAMASLLGYGSPMLIFIALFVWFASTQELRVAEYRAWQAQFTPERVQEMIVRFGPPERARAVVIVD